MFNRAVLIKPSRMFELLKTDAHTKARLGRLITAHGGVDTPVYMPVGTQASVKALDPRELIEMGTQIILGNTYHLNIRPGLDIIRAAGGLHRFMNWELPILTDSGGFQVFSLAKIRKIKPHGVEFRSHLDGSLLFLGPKEAMEIQRALGSDIAMVFDECPPHDAPAREHIFSGHEGEAGMALAHQHARLAVTLHQDECRRILRAHGGMDDLAVGIERFLAHRRRLLRGRTMAGLRGFCEGAAASARSKRNPPVSGAASAKRTLTISPRL